MGETDSVQGEGQKGGREMGDSNQVGPESPKEGLSASTGLSLSPLSEAEASLRECRGEALLQQVIALTELPEPLIRSELDGVLFASDQEPSFERLGLEELRTALLVYLEQVHQEVMADWEGDSSIH